MKAGIFYFTTSGNTESIADGLEEVLQEEGVEVIKKAFDEADASDLDELDLVALGTPAQGSEEVDESEFKPFYDENIDVLRDKKLFLFGSYGWGGGEFLDIFADEVKGDDMNVVAVFAYNEALDDDGKEQLNQTVKDIL